MRAGEPEQPAYAGLPEDRRRPALATTYLGHDPVLLERILPLVDYIETTPDSLACIRGGRVELHEPSMLELERISRTSTLILHGVGLSIGSYEGCSTRYVRLLDRMLERVDAAWHSEHLGYTNVGGENVGTMLALPRTEEVVDMLCKRIAALQERYRLPFLVEHVIHMLPEAPAEYSQAGFLNALAARTGCGLILDLYNLECDAHNHGLDVASFLDEIDFAAVRELHLACGTRFRGFQLDAHSRTTRESTIELAKDVIARAGGSIEVVVFELLREAVPLLGHDVIVGELERLRAALCVR